MFRLICKLESQSTRIALQNSHVPIWNQKLKDNKEKEKEDTHTPMKGKLYMYKQLRKFARMAIKDTHP